MGKYILTAAELSIFLKPFLIWRLLPLRRLDLDEQHAAIFDCDPVRGTGVAAEALEQGEVEPTFDPQVIFDLPLDDVLGSWFHQGTSSGDAVKSSGCRAMNSL